MAVMEEMGIAMEEAEKVKYNTKKIITHKEYVFLGLLPSNHSWSLF